MVPFLVCRYSDCKCIVAVYCRCTFCKSGAFFRVVYDDSYTNEYVVLRAKKTYGQKKYDIFEQNCEHSTRWCKTGIHTSSQIGVCFTTIGKAALVVGLRLISLIVLWLLQEQDESLGTQQERIVSGVYMIATACLFIAYSLYRSCVGVYPRVPYKHRDTDISQVESAQRRCADVTHRYCCCGARRCNAVVLLLCCSSCFFCSLFDACFSGCRKKVQCGRRTICRRPPSIIIGLFLRIFVRETIAAAGPFLVVYFEERIVWGLHIGTALEKFFAILGFIIVASLAAYLVGALVGVWLEASIIGCANCCCNRSAPDYDGGHENDNPNLVVNDTEN